MSSDQHTPKSHKKHHFYATFFARRRQNGPRQRQNGSRRRQTIFVEYFYGNGSPLFLRQCQMTSTPQNLIKNIIFRPQFLPGDVKMAPDKVEMAPGDVEL